MQTEVFINKKHALIMASTVAATVITSTVAAVCLTTNQRQLNSLKTEYSNVSKSISGDIYHLGYYQTRSAGMDKRQDWPDTSVQWIPGPRMEQTVNTNGSSSMDVNIKAPQRAEAEMRRGKYYEPYYNIGFSWYQFFKNPHGDYMQKIINNLKSKQIQNVRLGFITDFNDKSTNPQAKHIRDFKEKYGIRPLVFPAIDGISPLWTANFSSQDGSNDLNKPHVSFLNELRKNGIDFTFSLGGWNGNSLALAAHKKHYAARDLKNLYAKLIDKFKLNRLDFDIEGTDEGLLDDHGNRIYGKDEITKLNEAKQLRLDALWMLKRDYKYSDIEVAFTIPTSANGISNENKWMIKQGINDKIIDNVSIMTMDFPETGTLPNRITVPGEMAIMSINAANSLKNVITSTGVGEEDAYKKIGVVPMVGWNDRLSEIFYLTDALLLAKWAERKNIKMISEWNLLRELRTEISTNTELAKHHDLRVWGKDDKTKRKLSAFSTGLGIKTLAFSNIFRQISTSTLHDVSQFGFTQAQFENHLKALLDKYQLHSVENVLNLSTLINPELNINWTPEWRKTFDDEKQLWSSQLTQ